MGLTLRQDKGLPLDNAEVDGNFVYLEGLSEQNSTALETHKSSSDHDARYPLKTTTVTGTGALTGGGDLGSDQQIDASPETKASLAKADSALQPDGNLEGLADKAVARTNLGLGTSATVDASVTPAAGKIPVADSAGQIATGWATIIMRDSIRKAVEAASGGRQTVLYTAKGQPSYMYVLPAFNLEDLNAGLGTGLHPAFTVGGVAKREVFIGVYQGLVSNDELVSLPGVDPSTYRNHDLFVATARANGPGWHCITNAEWAALALWCWKNGFQPRGNNNYGRDIDSKWETGRRQDSGIPGDATGSPVARTLTGSGPASWRHDNSLFGISDLNGNIWEWTPGLRLCAGEFQVIADNDAALNATDLSATSTAWKAIDGDTGGLITPTFTGTIAGGDYVATTPKSVRIAASGTADYTVVRASGGSLEGMTNPGIVPVSADALARLKRLGLYPVAATGLGGDGIWHTQDVERLPVRGGDWVGSAVAGVFALNLNTSRASPRTALGSRPAFVL